MWRICLALTVIGGLVALLGAALFEGLSSMGAGGGYVVDYIGASSFTSGRFTSESDRYLAVTAVGAGIGLVAGAVLHFVGVRVGAGSRVGLTVLAGLVGCTIGLLPTLIPISVEAELPDGLSPLVVYAVTGVIAYALSLGAVYASLRAVGDTGAMSTVRATALALPIGAVLATAAGVFSAWVLGFSTATSTWIVVVIAVVLILCATFAVARGAGLGRLAG